MKSHVMYDTGGTLPGLGVVVDYKNKLVEEKIIIGAQPTSGGTKETDRQRERERERERESQTGRQRERERGRCKPQKQPPHFFSSPHISG